MVHHGDTEGTEKSKRGVTVEDAEGSEASLAN